MEVGNPSHVKLSVTNRATAGTAAPSLGLPNVEDGWETGGTDPDLAPAGPVVGPVDVVAPDAGRAGTGYHGVLLPGGTHRSSWCLQPPSTAVLGPRSVRVWSEHRYRDPDRRRRGPSRSAPPGWHLDVGAATALVGSMSTLDSGPGNGLGELEGLRPYVAGDRLSLLHWPAKIRYGTWFVRQFEGEGTATVSIVLDDRAGVHRRIDFERLVSAALGPCSSDPDAACGPPGDAGRPVLHVRAE